MKKKWQQFYLFMYEAKTTAGIYFLAFVFFYLVFGVFDTENAITLSFWTSMQIFLASLLIGLGQSFLLSNNELTVPRISLWSVWALGVTIGFSEGFGWFESYPGWYSLIFYSLITISFFFSWLALNWRLQKESDVLNDALTDYKEKNQGIKWREES
jgi:hypothetical protein